MQKDIDEVLTEIFAQSPLPNNLKTPKKRFLEGTLKELAKINLVRQHSTYEVVLLCRQK